MDINLLSNIGIASILAYLLGSIPFGQLVSRWRKVDIFRTGTQLSGASNVFQKTGHKLGVFVFFADAAKVQNCNPSQAESLVFGGAGLPCWHNFL